MKTKNLFLAILGLVIVWQVNSQNIPTPKAPGTNNTTNKNVNCESGNCENGLG